MAAILVVEDDLFIREVAEMMIADWGHSIFSASDVDEAIQHLNSAHHIHALFTDIHLKKEVHGGFVVAQMAVKLRPEMRVLYTTGHLMTDDMQAMCVTGSACLQKPYTERHLKESVERLVTP
jgi:DNA-binding NtrC family response regulator